MHGDRFPGQLLAYLRLSRVTEAADLMSVRFDADSPVSQMNEYEVLQLMMGDLRERLAAYEGGGAEEEAKRLQRRSELSGPQAAAAGLRLAEKGLLSACMGAVRRRLAPIRGVPTKRGMERKDADLFEIFEAIENPLASVKGAFNEMLGWDEAGEIKPPKSGCS